VINLATGKRWIQQMPISDKEKEEARDMIKEMDGDSMIKYLTQLREKCGSKFYMNKKAKEVAVK